MEHLADLPPLESINRCGECHRRSDQFTPDELTPQNKLLVRFAPVGLSLSACFKHQSAKKTADGTTMRLVCTTCHDPHREAERDPQHYVRQCRECHGPKPHQAPPCPTEPMTSNCLPCHMPQVEVQKHLRFTDHWIRATRDSGLGI